MKTNYEKLNRVSKRCYRNKLNKIRKREQTKIYSGFSPEDQLQIVHPLLQSFKNSFIKSPPRFTGSRKRQLQ